MGRLSVDVKKRAYRSAARAQQARETRSRILAAASRLFVERGYAATSIDDIAAEAGVTGRMVYLAFSNKRSLLDAAIGIALGGDDAPVLVRDRDWFRQALGAPGAQAPAIFAKFMRALHLRSAALLEAAEAAAAADPELVEPRDRGRASRYADMRQLAFAIDGASDPDVDYITDLLYALGSSALYAQFVFQRGWSPARYECWLRETIEAALINRPGADSNTPAV